MIIYSYTSTDLDNLAKIVSVNFEITGRTEIVNK